MTLAQTNTPQTADTILAADRKGRRRLLLQIGGIVAIIVLCLWLTGMLDGGRLAALVLRAFRLVCPNRDSSMSALWFRVRFQNLQSVVCLTWNKSVTCS